MTTKSLINTLLLLLLSTLFSNTNAYSNAPTTSTIEVYSPPGYIIIIDSGRSTHIVVKSGEDVEIVIKDESGKVVFRKENANKGDKFDVSHLPMGEYKIYVDGKFDGKFWITSE